MTHNFTDVAALQMVKILHFPASLSHICNLTIVLQLSAPIVNTAVLSTICLYSSAGDTFPSNEHLRCAYAGSFKSFVTKDCEKQQFNY